MASMDKGRERETSGFEPSLSPSLFLGLDLLGSVFVSLPYYFVVLVLTVLLLCFVSSFFKILFLSPFVLPALMSFDLSFCSSFFSTFIPPPHIYETIYSVQHFAIQSYP